MKVLRVMLVLLLAGPFLSKGAVRAQAAGAQEPQTSVQKPAQIPGLNQDFQKPEPWEERMRKQGKVLELSLKDAIRLALTKNLEIEIENYNEGINRERLVQTRGFYDPVLSFTVGIQSSTSPSTSVLTAGAGVATFTRKGFTWDNAVTQNVPGGGQFQVTFNNNRSRTNSTFSTINPQFTSNFQMNFTQPLWRGFMETNTERQIKLVNLDQKISDSQFEQRVSEIVQQVQNQYWELVYAIENHETQRQSMELALIQLKDNRKRVQIGVSAPIEITSAQAEVSTREQAMIQSEVQIIGAQNGLKRLLAPDPKDSIWNLALIPTDKPKTPDVTISLDQAIQTALSRRPELEQINFQLEQNEVNRKYYERQGKPSVNLRASFGSTGSSGDVFKTISKDLNGDGVPDTQERVPDPSNPNFGNLTNALGQTFGFDFRSWGIFADIQIPIRNRSNDGLLAQNAINERRYLSQLKNQQQMIMVDVRNAYESLGTQKKRLDAASMALKLSQEQLDGENKRFQAGLSTNFEVLRFQRDLAQAKAQELRARIDYEEAMTALQKAMYTIVDESDIVVAKRNNSGH